MKRHAKTKLHSDRTTGGDRDYRDPRGNAPAGAQPGAGEGADHQMPEPAQADLHRLFDVPRRLGRPDAAVDLHALRLLFGIAPGLPLPQGRERHQPHPRPVARPGGQRIQQIL